MRLWDRRRRSPRMPDSDDQTEARSAEDETSPGGLPLLLVRPPSTSTPGPLNSLLRSGSRPNFEVPSSQQNAPDPSPPRNHLLVLPAAQDPSPAPLTSPDPPARVAPRRGPSKRRGHVAGEGGADQLHPYAGDGASRRPPGRDKSCSAAGRTVPASPRPPPWWPRCGPPHLCRGSGHTIQAASGRRRPSYDLHSRPLPGPEPSSRSPGYVQCPGPLQPVWEAQSLHHSPLPATSQAQSLRMGPEARHRPEPGGLSGEGAFGSH